MKKKGEIGKIGETGKKTENRLRSICDGLSPKIRFVAVIVSLALFAMLAVYMAVSSIYFGQKAKLNIEHIEVLKLQRTNSDTINILNLKP